MFFIPNLLSIYLHTLDSILFVFPNWEWVLLAPSLLWTFYSDQLLVTYPTNVIMSPLCPKTWKYYCSLFLWFLVVTALIWLLNWNVKFALNIYTFDHTTLIVFNLVKIHLCKYNQQVYWMRNLNFVIYHKIVTMQVRHCCGFKYAPHLWSKCTDVFTPHRENG